MQERTGLSCVALRDQRDESETILEQLSHSQSCPDMRLVVERRDGLRGLLSRPSEAQQL